MDLDPNPPAAGKTLTVTARGTLSEAVEEGAKVHLQVKYGLITIIKQTADLCDTVTKVDLECPLKKGETTLTKDIDLPKVRADHLGPSVTPSERPTDLCVQEIPPGKYSVIADVYTKDEKKVTCLQATVEFKRGGNAVLVDEAHQDI